MLADEFWTIAEPGTAQMRVLGSRFFATAFACTTEFVLQNFIESLKKKHYDASHHCWAMVLRAEADALERSSDAGEPKGTAGLPILHEMKSRELLDCAVVVTRWFGGTKLGTGGLVRAYRGMSALALNAAQRIRRRTGITVTINSPFELQSHIYHLAGKFGAPLESEAIADGALFYVRLRHSQVDAFEAALVEQTAGRLSIAVGDTWIS
ncbi:MAG: YigZ family protein [bacterium]|nr:YigZ family protein [bacterium]